MNGPSLAEPAQKRAIVFVDGQNLYHAARETFGCAFPNYDVLALSNLACRIGGWSLCEVRFYTGFPDAKDDPHWNTFWTKNRYDVAVVFSQDQDLSEVADEIRVIAREQQRWIKMASAFPQSPRARNCRGINNTEWLKIDRASYDLCVDTYDYRT